MSEWAPLDGPPSGLIAAATIRARRLPELEALRGREDVDQYRLERTIALLTERTDGRWWLLYQDLTAEQLVNHVCPPLPRQLPPVPYEELP